MLGIVGLMKTALPVPMRFRRVGATLLMLGGMGRTTAERFGSTEYAKVILNQLWGLPPELDMDYEKRVHNAIRAILAEGLAESAHDLSDGGLAVSLAECCTGEIGASVRLTTEDRLEFTLFGESPSRILLTTSNAARIQEIALSFGVECLPLGVTMESRLQIGDEPQMWIDIETADLGRAFEASLPALLSGPTSQNDAR